MTDTTAQEATPATTAQAADDTSTRMAILEKELNEARKEAAKYRTERKAQEAEAQKRAEQEAAAKGEFEKIATERGARLVQIEAEHTTVSERYAALTEAMEQQIRARVKALPEKLRDLLIDGDVLMRYQQLAKLEAAAAELAPKAEQPRAYDINGGARGTNTTTSEDILERNRQRLLNKGARY